MPIEPGVVAESAEIESVAKKGGTNFYFNEGGAVLAAGRKAFIRFPDGPSTYTIEKVTLMANPSGSCTIDLYVESDMEANGLPTATESIVGADNPTLSSDDYAEKTSFTGWTLNISPGSVMVVNLDSISLITELALAIDFVKTEV